MHPGGGTSHHRVSASSPSPVLSTSPPIRTQQAPTHDTSGGGGDNAPHLPDVTPPGAAQGIMRQAKKNFKNRWSGCGDAEEEAGLLLAAGASEVPVDTPQLPPRSAANSADLHRVIHNTLLSGPESKTLSSEHPVSLSSSATSSATARDRKETVC